jgi:hypothetical protein
MNHVFSGYENKLVVDAAAKVGTVRLKNAFDDNVDVFARENYFDLVKKGDKGTLPVVSVELFDGARAPIARDTVLGKIIVTDEGVVVREIDVVAGVDVNGLGFFDAVRKVTRNFKF